MTGMRVAPDHVVTAAPNGRADRAVAPFLASVDRGRPGRFLELQQRHGNRYAQLMMRQNQRLRGRADAGEVEAAHVAREVAGGSSAVKITSQGPGSTNFDQCDRERREFDSYRLLDVPDQPAE